MSRRTAKAEDAKAKEAGKGYSTSSSGKQSETETAQQEADRMD